MEKEHDNSYYVEVHHLRMMNTLQARKIKECEKLIADLKLAVMSFESGMEKIED